ncbi:hypothetical protein BGZ65_003006, partial [Modicella reniformis]
TNIASLVNDTIKALQEYKSDAEIGLESATDNTGFSNLEALEGADLRQLESYLKVKDRERVLGNLHRMVTPEGHVKWVCLDHYRSVYKEPELQLLRDFVEVNNGRFMERTGKIDIKIASGIQARQFYEAMTRLPGVQELDIMLEWDASTYDLQYFANAVTKANVIRLTVDGTHLKGSTNEFGIRNRDYDPILQLVSNGQIQSFRLQNFNDFFRHVSSPSIPTSMLRVLSIDSEIPFTKNGTKSYLNCFLEQCSSLSTLELKLHRHYSIGKVVSETLMRLHQLESLKIDCGEISIAAIFSQGKTQVMTMKIDVLHDLNSDLKVIQKDHLTQLEIRQALQEGDEVQLVDVLRHSPRLNHLQIGCEEGRYLAITDLVISARATVLQERGLPCLQSFKLKREGHIEYHLSFPEASSAFDMSTWIRLPAQTLITAKHPICDFVRQYGWSIVSLVGPWTISDHFVAILGGIISTRNSQLRRLDLDPFSFTLSGYHALDRIIRRSQSFVELRLFLNHLEKKSQVKKGSLLFSRYRKILGGLELHGDSPDQWLPWISSSFPNRNSFPNLVSFGLGFSSRCNVPPDCVSWIVAMVSAPSQALASSSCSATEEPWKGLEKLSLKGVVLQPEEWKTVIEAIDFSALQSLDFNGANFSRKQFKLLVDCVPDRISKVLLKDFNIANTDLAKSSNLRAIHAELWIKAPFVEVIGV